MAEKFKVTTRVYVDHPKGYRVLAHLPGEEIPHGRAVELGLVKDKDEPKSKAEKKAEAEVVTAEVRRAKKAGA